jgi:alpha-D-ribose 1-methylphosphonate 5-triphosphate synthase subunit PhnI
VTTKGKSGQLQLGFCATLGWNEVKVISGATLDLNMPAASKGSSVEEEFVLYHTEPVEASGFCIHFKLPHYVTFQSSLDALRGAAAVKSTTFDAAAAEPEKVGV